MRLKARTRYLLTRGGRWDVGPGLSVRRQSQRPLAQFEKMEHAQAFEQLGHTLIGIEQLDEGCVCRGVWTGHLQAVSSQNSEESAIHQGALGKFEHEPGKTPLPQFLYHGPQIDTGGESRPANNPYAGELLARQDHHFG